MQQHWGHHTIDRCKSIKAKKMPSNVVVLCVEPKIIYDHNVWHNVMASSQAGPRYLLSCLVALVIIIFTGN